MDAAGTVAGWRQRLTALADSPAHVYLRTAPDLIEREQRRRTGFAGYPEADVAAAEVRLGGRFPAVFRQYLLEMARSPGDLFRGSDLAGPAGFEGFRTDALRLLAETDPALTLPREAAVFLFHQGYTFTYVLAIGGSDGPPMRWMETEPAPERVAEGFADMVDAEIGLMERTNRSFREGGGYYRTLHRGGGESMIFPARGGGDRPLDR